MADIRTTIRIDSVGADRVKRDFAEVTAANDKAASGFQKTGTAASSASGGIENLGAKTRTYAAHAEVAAKSSNAFGVGLAALSRAGAIAAGVGLLANAIKGAVGELDDLGDQAQKLGLTATALQELQDAARRSDADVSTLNGSWEKFTKAVGEATQGSGKLNDVLKQYNIALLNSDGSTRSTMALYLDLADAAKKTGNSTEVARLSAAMFGREGIAMAPMLVKGADGFRNMAKEAHEAGRIVSEDLVKAAGDMQTAYDRMLDTLTAKWRSFAVIVAQSLNLVDQTERQKLTRSIGIYQEQLGRLNKYVEGGPRTGAQSGYDMLTGQADEKAERRFQEVLAQRAEVMRTLLDLKTRLVDLDKAPVNPGFVAPESEGDAAARDAAAAKAATELEKAQRAAEKAIHDRMMMESDERVLADKITDDYLKDAAAKEKADKAATASRDAYMASLDDELGMLGLTDRARAIEIERLNAEAEAVKLVGDEKAKYVAAAMAKRGEIYDKEQIVAAAKKSADEVQAVWDRARDDFSDSWSDLFYGIFNDGKFRFKDLADSFKSIWARTLADLLTMSIQDSFIKPMFDGLFGGAGGGTGAGGTTGIFGSLGASLFGGGSKAAGASGASGAAGGALGALGTIGSGIAGIGLALGIGKMGGSATGGLVGSTVVGAAGSVLGTLGILGAAAGPIGVVVGAILGGVLGGLMKPSPRSSSSVTTSGSGVLGIGDSYALGLDIKIGQDMANGVIRALKTFSEQLVTGLENDAFLGIVGQRGKKFFFQAQESDLKTAGKSKNGAVKFKEAEDAIAFAIEAAINSGVVKGLTDADKKLMRAATSVQEAMADVVASHNFKRELDFQFTGLSSPLAEAQARLEFEYQQQLILAEKYEADKTKLEAVYAQKRLDLVEQYNSQQYAGLKSFLTSITAGSASPLSPTTRLGLAQANYSTLSAKARSGDQDAIAALQGAAQDYLSAGKDVFASGGGYQSIYQQVVGDLSSITGVANPLGVGAASNTNVAAAVNDNTRAQAGWFTQAAAQRTATNSKLDTLNSNVSALVVALSRGSATPTQSGTVQVGTIDWASVTQAVASLR